MPLKYKPQYGVIVTKNGTTYEGWMRPGGPDDRVIVIQPAIEFDPDGWGLPVKPEEIREIFPVPVPDERDDA